MEGGKNSSAPRGMPGELTTTLYKDSGGPEESILLYNVVVIVNNIFCI